MEETEGQIPQSKDNQSGATEQITSQSSGSGMAQPISGAGRLTPEQADAKLSMHNMKTYVRLLDEGRNVRPWRKMIRDTAAMKRCLMAMQQDYPDTAVDAAATQLLMSSVSDYFQNIISTLPTAHSSYNYITRRFMRGHNHNANTVWFSQLEAGMQPTEFLEQYRMRLHSIYQCLKDNLATVEEFHVMKQLVRFTLALLC